MLPTLRRAGELEPSIPGLLVCAILLLIGGWLGAPVLIGLFASLAFGSTAFATLTALGGSSPLIYTLFALALIVVTLCRKSFARDIGTVLGTHRSAWIVMGLVLYTFGSAIILPRLFIGQTTAFVIYRGSILELPLQPTNGNITQAAYFAVGALTYFVFSMALLRRDGLRVVTLGFFVYVGLNALLGALDLAGKLVGLGDILIGIRTANYALLTEISEGGFWRIVGGHPEASSFAIFTISGLAFCFAYWRASGSRLALALGATCLMLVMLSTSSTGYGAIALLGAVFAIGSLRSMLRGRILARDLAIAACVPIFLGLVATIYVVHPKAVEPVINLVDSTLIKKAESQSAQERAYWNARSLSALGDTMGLGIGLGSSRASSWIIAVISQLGVVGTLLMIALLAALLKGPGPGQPTAPGDESLALFKGARACAFAFLIGASLSGGAADPGVLFFICLAVVVSLRRSFNARLARPAARPRNESVYPLPRTAG